jgi:hypothetical protein
MAKSKASVYYCKFCDEVLKGDHKFCSEACKKIWLKTHNTPTETIHKGLQNTVKLLREGNMNIPDHCKANYTFCKQRSVIHDNVKFHIQLYGYIYNKNKEKAFKTFEKFKRFHQDELDEQLFGGEIRPTILACLDGTQTMLEGEESLRVSAMLINLSVHAFELMLQQTF